MYHRSAHVTQPITLARLQMDGVTKDRPSTQQSGAFIGVEIVSCLREKLFDPSDFVGLLAQVGLHQAVGMLAP